MFENAKWIAASLTQKTDGSHYFRRKIKVPCNFKTAVLNIAMLGYGVAEINGKAVTDEVLLSPYTAYDKTVLYKRFDVTELLEYESSILSVHLGNGMYNDNASTWDFQCAPWRHHPKLIAQLDIELPTGGVLSYVSDSSWKVAEGPCVYNHSREGETYDARLEIPGWKDDIYLEEERFGNARICRAPGGILKLDKSPGIKVIREIKPVCVNGDIYDFGENISGWAKIRAEGEAGREIKLEYDERLDENGNFVEHINAFLKRTNSAHINYDAYIMKGEGEESYSASFCYHGFRYVKVTGAPENFEIVAEVVHTDLKTIGSFECSDEMLNKIHDASVRSMLTNYVGIPTDCPHREQNGWTGDAALSCQQALLNFDIYSAYEKWMGDIQDCQRPSGQIPGIVPTGGWGYNWGSGPAWDACLMIMPWQIYQNTGNDGILHKMWGNMKLYMDYIAHMADGYIVNFGLGDWCPPDWDDVTPAVVTDTAYYFVFAKTMAKAAEHFGEDGTEYERLADGIKSAFREKFCGKPEYEKKQTFLACVVYQGLCEDDECQSYADKLAEKVKENGYRFDCGILGIKYAFSVLSDYGYADVAYKAVINPEMPSYAYWINQGFNTLCESWNISNSCNHHMYSEVDHWFYRHLAGIRLDETGLVIKPCFVVDWVKAKHRGIEVSWDREKIEIISPIPATLEMNGKSYSLKIGENKFVRN